MFLSYFSKFKTKIKSQKRNPYNHDSIIVRIESRMSSVMKDLPENR